MAELWLGKKGSLTEESDGETAGVLILLAAIYLIFSIENYAFERMNKERLNGFHRSRGESLNRVRAMTNEPKSLSIGYSNVQSSFLKDTDEEDKPKQLVKGVRRMPSSDVSHVVPKTRDPFNSARISVCGPDGGKKPFRSFRLVLPPKEKSRKKKQRERQLGAHF